MSTVEDAANQTITTLVETLRLCRPDESESAALDFDRDLRMLEVDLWRVMSDRLGYIFTPGSTRLICDMPGNRHSFSGNNQKCRHCHADFCPTHAASPCPKCNRV